MSSEGGEPPPDSSPPLPPKDSTIASTGPPKKPSTLRLGSSRKPSSSSLAIFNRTSQSAPSTLHWQSSSGSSGSSSPTSTMISLSSEDEADGFVEVALRSHLQTCLDDRKIANRAVTVVSALSQCSTEKGFNGLGSSQPDGSSMGLLIHAGIVDTIPDDCGLDRLANTMQWFDKGVDDFINGLEELPFEVRNADDCVSTFSAVLEARASLAGTMSRLTPDEWQGAHSKDAVQLCRYECNAVLVAIRLCIDTYDLAAAIHAKSLPKESAPSTWRDKLKRFLPLRRATLGSKAREKGEGISSELNFDDPEPLEDAEVEDLEYYSNMFSEIITPQELERQHYIKMPGPIGEAAVVQRSEETGRLEGATLAALVHILTDPQVLTLDKNHVSLLDAFLVCFRSFCGPVDVAKALMSRYDERPRRMNRTQRAVWPSYRSALRSRVLRLITTWIDEYWIHGQDRFAGLHIKEFILDNRRAEAIALAPSVAEVNPRQPELEAKSASRIACRQAAIQYPPRIQEKMQAFIRTASSEAPTDEELRSARALDELIGENGDRVHVLEMNSRDLCHELARQLTIFMSEGYRRVVPEELWHSHGKTSRDQSASIRARTTQQDYEDAITTWVMTTVLDQIEAEARVSVLNFFIALALRCHGCHNYSAMRCIYNSLSEHCLGTLSEARLPLSVHTTHAFKHLKKLVENTDQIAASDKAAETFPQPAVPYMKWCMDEYSLVVDTSTHLSGKLAKVGRWFDIMHVLREMEHWHMPYNYPRADRVQAWLLRTFEAVITRNAERETNWVARQCAIIEETGRPEPPKQKLVRISNAFGRRNSRGAWKTATVWQLIPELEPKAKPKLMPSRTFSTDTLRAEAAKTSSKPLPPLPNQKL
ncbi:ras guanine nucleotide exchange factor domain-containing protein [Gloeopeniophorella convolvens]|nr:ras guanine nucleotide exchange factor domain-containing protein [Gloeopeniophorella convolvens]